METETHGILNQRQVIYWRLLTAMFDYTEQAANLDSMALEVTDALEMPRLILNERVGVDDYLHRYPEFESEFQLDFSQDDPQAPPNEIMLRRGLIISKLLLNVFGPNTQQNTVTAAQYAQWLKDVAHLERCLGFAPGSLRVGGTGGMGTENPSANGQGNNDGGQSGRPRQSEEGGAGLGTGSGFDIDEHDLSEVIQGLEKDLIQRMALREVLKDNKLANQLAPSMPLVEQLLRDKAHLSGSALNNAKRIIQQYVDEVAEILRLEVFASASSKIDYSVPPKKVFRNLDLKRTIWQNLTNWDDKERRLYVNRLYYRHTARKKLPTRMIVVVDQSGSMVDAMVQCTILASIFAGLPNVDVHLIAFDTEVIDLSSWVNDPFEVLLRTNLGGGTHINSALHIAMEKIQEPKNTALVLITDFYEGGSDQALLDTMKSIVESGVHFFPVGAVTSSGYFSVNQWFRSKLKELGRPILTGSPKKLIEQLKQVIVI